MLKEKKLNPKLPTCTQLEEKSDQLTVKQTNESRMVTKVKY